MCLILIFDIFSDRQLRSLNHELLITLKDSFKAAKDISRSISSQMVVKDKGFRDLEHYLSYCPFIFTRNSSSTGIELYAIEKCLFSAPRQLIAPIATILDVMKSEYPR